MTSSAGLLTARCSVSGGPTTEAGASTCCFSLLCCAFLPAFLDARCFVAGFGPAGRPLSTEHWQAGALHLCTRPTLQCRARTLERVDAEMDPHAAPSPERMSCPHLPLWDSCIRMVTCDRGILERAMQLHEGQEDLSACVGLSEVYRRKDKLFHCRGGRCLRALRELTEAQPLFLESLFLGPFVARSR